MYIYAVSSPKRLVGLVKSPETPPSPALSPADHTSPACCWPPDRPESRKPGASAVKSSNTLAKLVTFHQDVSRSHDFQLFFLYIFYIYIYMYIQVGLLQSEGLEEKF